jgi:hypothetical protein
MSEKRRPLLGASRVAAEQLQVDYARLVDDKDGAGWAALFGADGALVVGDDVITGPETLASFAENARSGVHIQGVASFSLADDGTVDAVAPFVFIKAEDGGTIAGWYEDKLVPAGDGYTFARRRIDIRTPR